MSPAQAEFVRRGRLIESPAVRSLAMYALLFVSGSAGLVYEVAWSRQLGLLVGLGERGAALTVGAFFGGMTLGYALAMPLSARLARPWRAYALCECFLAGWALLMPWWSGHLPREHAGLVGWLAMLPACAAMGASLPFALDAVARAEASVPRAYAWQLAGATAGTLATTFVLIARLGVWHSTYAAAAASAGCAAIAASWSSPPARRQSRAERPTVLWHAVAALAGAATLALEVLSLRLFALTFHNSTYTFGLTVAVFLVCLALGSRWLARRLEREPGRARGLAVLAAFAAALGTLLTVPLFALLTGFGTLRAFSFASYFVLAAGLLLMILALPVAAAGVLLPACFASATSPAGRAVATLSTANGLGSAAGALLATFGLLPGLGLTLSLGVVALAYLVLGVVLARSRGRALMVALAMAPLAVLAQCSVPGAPPGDALVGRWQTSSGWLDLVRMGDDGSLSARLDLHYQLGSSRDRARHAHMGELPLALHPRPERVLFIGLATGMTASGALSHRGVKAIDVVELIPEMGELARRFAAYNARLLDDRRVRVIRDDGRAYLHRSGPQYDVIVSDLFVPWHGHTGYLYTVEHFRAVQRRLAPGGRFAQWLPLWQLGAAELASIGDSLASVFPRPTLWLDDTDPTRPTLALLTGESEQAASLARARRLGRWRFSGAALNTDEHPRVELLAPRTERSQEVLTGERLGDFLRAHVD
jgi:spermidine synthase